MFNIGDTVLHYIGTPYKATITKIYKNGNVENTEEQIRNYINSQKER